MVLSYVPNSREPEFNRMAIWTIVHCGMGMVCACLPVCWPLFTRIATVYPSLVRKQWHRLSGWTLIERGSKSRSNSSDLGRNTTFSRGARLRMDDLSHKGVKTREVV